MYPIWVVPYLSSALVIGLIASFHILPSHLAVGAFWFNIYIERKAYREGRPAFLSFIKRYTLLILIFCFVFGSLSGVGIWYSATVSSPRGISALIHNYVWGWATEWVFFLIEVAAIYAYYYTLGKVDERTHLRIGYLYALSAWISMIIITGILAFMLTPGKWLETGGFFDGFFNPTYWPQLGARTFFMFGIAGLYALIIAATLKEREVAREVARLAGAWGLGGLLLGGLCGYWWLKKLPSEAQDLLFGGTLPYLATLLKVAAICGGIVGLYFLVFGIALPKFNNVPLAILTLIVLFLGILSGEGLREGLRRPYVINGFMYAHQVVGADLPAKGIKSEVELLNERGYLSRLGYLPPTLRTITEKNRVVVGRILVAHECANCHALSPKGIRSLPRLLKGLGMEDPEDLAGFLEGLDGYSFMPPFVGTEEERLAAGAYLSTLVRTNP